eukprot:3411419-Pleurochrysis_carterae.AAC.4
MVNKLLQHPHATNSSLPVCINTLGPAPCCAWSAVNLDVHGRQPACLGSASCSLVPGALAWSAANLDAHRRVQIMIKRFLFYYTIRSPPKRSSTFGRRANGNCSAGRRRYVPMFLKYDDTSTVHRCGRGATWRYEARRISAGRASRVHIRDKK